MTPEQRLDRLERLAKIFIRAGRRARTNSREQHEKINILIDMQNQNEDRFNERFLRNEERFGRNEERFARNEERFERTEQAIDRLIASQSSMNDKLQALIDRLRSTDFGGSLA